MPTLNQTETFYTGDAPSLLWEMTLCQSLADPSAAYAEALDAPRPFGAILAGWLADRIAIAADVSVLEVGGGYGTLMAALAAELDFGPLTMVDISPRFSAIQREALSARPDARFVTADVFRWLGETDETFDLVVSNENIGDFPTLEGLTRAMLCNPNDDPTRRAATLVARYALDLPDGEAPFAFNLGALEYLEALLPRAGVIFLSEHSCDLTLPAPWSEFLTPTPTLDRTTRRPRRIDLKDHAEYSIRFDHLEAVARAHGRTVERVAMVELLGVRSDEGARFMAGAECVGSERAETIHEFLHHVKEYECLLIRK